MRVLSTLIIASLYALAMSACANVNPDGTPNTESTTYTLLTADGGVDATAPNPSAQDFACDGMRLSMADLNTFCPDRTATCYHVCLTIPTSANSRSDQAWQRVRPTSVMFTQWGDRRANVNQRQMTVGAISDIVGAFINVQSGLANWALFSADWMYPAASARPPLRLIGQNYIGLGLDANGGYTMYRVNNDGTQTLHDTQVVALDAQCPTVTTDSVFGARATSPATGSFPNGGAIRPWRAHGDTTGCYPCPTDSDILSPRTGGAFACGCTSNNEAPLWGQAPTGIAGCQY